MAEPTNPSIASLRVRRLEQVNRFLWAIAVLMLFQGALGIYVNLFAGLALPSDPNASSAVFPVVFSNAILAVHFLNALVLIALSAAILALGGPAGIPRLRFWAGVLLAVFVGATYSGYHFVGTQENVYSFVMEMAFLAALGLVIVLVQRSGFLLRAIGAGSASVPAEPALEAGRIQPKA